MASRNVLRLSLVATLAFTLVVALIAPGLTATVDAQKKTTVVSKVTVATQRHGGQVTLAAGLGGTPATNLPVNQKKFTLQVKSKKVDKVDKIAVAYSCYNAAGDLTAQKFKELRPVEGISLPAKLSLSLKSPSETCYITGAVDAPWTGQDREKLTMTLKTASR